MSAASTRRLIVADSFRVRANPRTGTAEVRGLADHLRRFRFSALGQLPGADARARIDVFLDEAVDRIAEYGEGFPRLELWEAEHAGGDPELSLSLRPLPELRDTIELRSAPGVLLDHPERKGPNISRLAELNRRLGAEALLLDGAGRAVVEGATTSLIWWGDAGDSSGRFVADARATERANRVPSVTEGLLRRAADARLVGRKPERQSGSLSPATPTVAELAGAEVWAVNALHGIRVVTSIDGVPQAAPEERRLRWFREALDRCWHPLV